MTLSNTVRKKLALIQQIATLSVRTLDKPTITLASGKQSNFYIDIRAAMMDSRCAQPIAVGMLGLLKELKSPHYIGGVANGGIPLVQAMLAEMDFRSYARRPRGLILLAQGKIHGAPGSVAGLPVGESLQGKRVVVIEDTITTGKSVLKVVDVLRDKGAKPTAVLSVVDRGRDSFALFTENNLKFASLFRAEDFYPAGFTPVEIDPAEIW